MTQTIDKENLENDASAPHAPSIDPSEIEKFRKMASEWWDPKGKFRPLHKFNPTRIGFLRKHIVSHFALDGSDRQPLKGLRILDIGCGGGLVSEPLARLGAQMVSVDAGEANIKAAIAHADQSNLEIDYRVGSVEALIGHEKPFDVVLNLEVVEHTANPYVFLKDCARLVRPGGLMFVATLNRTPKAFALAIVGAEYILRWLPPGTHEFEKFLRPDEVRKGITDGGLVIENTSGFSYNPLLDSWSVTNDLSVNYMSVASRPFSNGLTSA